MEKDEKDLIKRLTEKGYADVFDLSKIGYAERLICNDRTLAMLERQDVMPEDKVLDYINYLESEGDPILYRCVCTNLEEIRSLGYEGDSLVEPELVINAIFDALKMPYIAVTDDSDTGRVIRMFKTMECISGQVIKSDCFLKRMVEKEELSEGIESEEISRYNDGMFSGEELEAYLWDDAKKRNGLLVIGENKAVSKFFDGCNIKMRLHIKGDMGFVFKGNNAGIYIASKENIMIDMRNSGYSDEKEDDIIGIIIPDMFNISPITKDLHNAGNILIRFTKDLIEEYCYLMENKIDNERMKRIKDILNIVELNKIK